MKAKSRKRLLISSVAMLLVAMLALGTATFAWFTNNKKVTADGMQVTATAAKGLQITGKNGIGSDPITNESGKDLWGPKATFTTHGDLQAVSVPYSAAPDSGTAATAYGTTLPANAFYPTNVSSSGVLAVDKTNATNFTDWKDDAAYPTITTTSNSEAVNASANNHFQAYQVGVRFTEDTSDAAAITVNAKLSVAGVAAADAAVLQYMRVAVISDTGTAPFASLTGTGKGIVGVYTDAADTHALNAKTGDNMVNAYTEHGTAGSDITWTFSGVKKSTPKYFTVLVWFEGQDDDCIDANASLSGKINLEFSYT